MDDVVGRRGWNPCRHNRVFGNHLKMANSVDDWSFNGARPWIDPGFMLTLVPLPPEDLVNEYGYAFIQEVLDLGLKGPSLANFLLELRHVLGSTLSFLGRLLKGDSASQEFIRLWQIYRRSVGTPREAAARHALEDLFLGYQFGLKPALQDLEGILTALGRIADRIEHLYATMGQTYTNYRRHSLSIPTDDGWQPALLLEGGTYKPDDPEWYVRPSEYFGVIEVRLARLQTRLNLRADISNELVGDEFLLNFFSALNHYFRLDNPASIAWEATGFSWLVDWVVNIGKLLDDNHWTDLDAQTGKGGRLTVVDSFWSYKQFADFEVRHRYTRIVDGTLVEHIVDCGTIEVIRYARNLGIPCSLNLLFAKKLDLRRTAILAAIIKQRTRKKRARPNLGRGGGGKRRRS